MEENRKQELAKLLEESLQSIVIEHPDFGKISHQRYREFFLSNKRIRDINSIKLGSKISVHNDHVKIKLIDFVRVELSKYILDDRIGSCMFRMKGGVASPFLDCLLESLWRISLVWNIERAIIIFERTVKKNQISFQENTVIRGIKIEHKIQISDGIKLLPLPNLPENLPNYLPDTSSGAELEFLSKTLLVVDYVISPALIHSCSENFPQEFHEETINKEMEGVNGHNFCEILSLLHNTSVQPTIQWDHVNDDEFFVHEMRITTIFWGSGNQFLRDILIHDIQVERVKNLYRTLISLNPKVRERIRMPIMRWRESKKNKGMVEKMIDLGIAFESLYINPNNRGQFSFTLSIRAAWYLGKDKEDRKKLMKLFKDFYDYRSKAVHTGKLPNTFRKGNETIPINQFIEEAQDLCLESIMKIIESGEFPDWDSVIVGGYET